MKGLMMIMAVVVLTLLGLVIFTQYDGGQSVSRVGGYPVVSLGGEAEGIIAVGGFGKGVIVIGGGGVGLIVIGLYGFGFLFGTGQLCAGIFAAGQLGFGLVLFMGQVGAGLQVMGQGGLAYRKWTQGVSKHKQHFVELGKELDELLMESLPWRRLRR